MAAQRRELVWLAERQPGLQDSVHTSLFIFAVGRGREGFEQRGTGQVMLLLVGSHLGVREVSPGRGLAASVGVGLQAGPGGHEIENVLCFL